MDDFEAEAEDFVRCKINKEFVDEMIADHDFTDPCAWEPENLDLAQIALLEGDATVEEIAAELERVCGQEEGSQERTKAFLSFNGVSEEEVDELDAQGEEETQRIMDDYVRPALEEATELVESGVVTEEEIVEEFEKVFTEKTGKSLDELDQTVEDASLDELVDAMEEVDAEYSERRAARTE